MANNPAYAREWRLKNADKIKAYRRKNAEVANAAAKKWRQENPEQAREKTAKWNREHPERVRELWLRRYGISNQDYDDMFAAQNGVCKICKLAQQNKRLAVDHCHVTNTVRGLLCENCNQALGKMKDSPDLLEAAAAYLRFPFDFPNEKH